MSRRDIDEGRLILMFGLAAVRAAEFQIARVQILTGIS
jgi:phage tail sheath protein FI